MDYSGQDQAKDSPEEVETFGTRFLTALREEGLPLSGFNYATIQDLKRADRDQTIRILIREVGNLSYVTVQQLKKEEPEEVARRIAQRAQVTGQSVTLMMLLLM